MLGAMGDRARSISMVEWLKLMKDTNAGALLSLTKTDFVRCFTLAAR